MQALDQLNIRSFLTGIGWHEQQIQLALTHIISRATYPASELRTSQWIKENSAVCELTGYPIEKITKDKLYDISKDLYKVKEDLEKRESCRLLVDDCAQLGRHLQDALARRRDLGWRAGCKKPVDRCAQTERKLRSAGSNFGRSSAAALLQLFENFCTWCACKLGLYGIRERRELQGYAEQGGSLVTVVEIHMTTLPHPSCGVTPNDLVGRARTHTR